MAKQPRPTTVCTDCGRAGYSIQLANRPCGYTRADGRRCRGVNGSANQETDWLECPYCDGEGGEDIRCHPCDGAGWMFVRDKPWLKKEIEAERKKRKS